MKGAIIILIIVLVLMSGALLWYRDLARDFREKWLQVLLKKKYLRRPMGWKPKIYVASSWRNNVQPYVVKVLREAGYEVYDFKNPPQRAGFGWEQIGHNWQNWSMEQFRAALKHPLAEAGFKSDFEAMQDADVCVMVMPCGRSAHTEAGWMAGAGKQVFAYIYEMAEPELMYKVFDGIATDKRELLDLLKYVS
jgi:hypothetical protein